jgi:microcystin-dependent protein
MSDPYIGEIRMFAGNFAPAGWAFCNGQLMPISENDALFTLIGTTYGGDGQETFGLPNFAGRVPVHQGQGSGISQNYIIGEVAGVESVTLSTQQMPVHNHALMASTAGGTSTNPADHVLASPPSATAYLTDTPSTALASSTLSPVGGSQPHENMPPYLAVSFIISLFGIYPHT